MRIDIDTEWFIDADATCVTLARKVVVTGSGKGAHMVKAENIGTVNERPVGYYGSVRDALIGYVEKSVNMSDAQFTSLTEHLDAMKAAVNRVVEALVPVAASIPAPATDPAPRKFAETKKPAQAIQLASGRTIEVRAAIAPPAPPVVEKYLTPAPQMPPALAAVAAVFVPEPEKPAPKPTPPPAPAPAAPIVRKGRYGK